MKYYVNSEKEDGSQGATDLTLSKAMSIILDALAEGCEVKAGLANKLHAADA